MKKLFFAALLLLSIQISYSQERLSGAWQLLPTGTEPQTILIIEDGYFMQTVFDEAGKKFLRTHGGTLKEDAGTFTETIEFDTEKKENVGTSRNCTYKLSNNTLTAACDGQTLEWTRLDDSQKAPLAGTWRITGRENNGEMSTIKPGPRKTLKILSGTRFQWVAINTETKEFFGTGGGTYTFTDGAYTEHIAFFSRDDSRVGMKLSFNGKVDGNNWHHSGKSSKGDPISEIWSKTR